MALHLCYLQWLSLVKFYPLDPPTLDFFADFHWDMSGNLINIYNLRYNTVVLKKKSLKLLQIALLGPYLGKNSASRGHAQNQVQFFLEITKGDHKLSRTFFILSKYCKFWLSYEWFSGWNKQGKETCLTGKIATLAFGPSIVTRNNIVQKLVDAYCLCYCKTFLLVPHSRVHKNFCYRKV